MFIILKCLFHYRVGVDLHYTMADLLYTTKLGLYHTQEILSAYQNTSALAHGYFIYRNPTIFKLKKKKNTPRARNENGVCFSRY